MGNEFLAHQGLFGCYVFASNNSFTENMFTNHSEYAIGFANESTDNSVWNNTFNLNHGSNGTYSPTTVQAIDNGTGNSWYRNDSSFIGGNNWSDWRLPDSNGNGFVDSAYFIDGNAGASDSLPLALPLDAPNDPSTAGTDLPPYIAVILIGAVMAVVALALMRRNRG